MAMYFFAHTRIEYLEVRREGSQGSLWRRYLHSCVAAKQALVRCVMDGMHGLYMDGGLGESHLAELMISLFVLVATVVSSVIELRQATALRLSVDKAHVVHSVVIGQL